jgi:hypothetical protein
MDFFLNTLRNSFIVIHTVVEKQLNAKKPFTSENVQCYFSYCKYKKGVFPSIIKFA